MTHARKIILATLLLSLGCATGSRRRTDAGTDVPTDAADTAGEADVPRDRMDASDPAPEPDVVDDFAEEDAWDAAPETTTDPEEDNAPDVVDAFDAYDAPRDPRPDPDASLDTAPDATDATYDFVDITLDPSGDCVAGTCTDIFGRTVCVGGSGYVVCPYDARCLQICVCDAPGSFGLCRMPCICP